MIWQSSTHVSFAQLKDSYRLFPSRLGGQIVFFLRMSIIQSANRNVRNRVDNATVAGASRAKSHLETRVSGQRSHPDRNAQDKIHTDKISLDKIPQLIRKVEKRPQFPDSKTGFRASSEFVVRLPTGHRFRLEAVCYRDTAGGDMFDYNERDALTGHANPRRL